MNKKIVVIGGGPAGYVAAIRAAQLGSEVHLIEKENLGGTCLNLGCIPTKALLHSVEVYNNAKNGRDIGVIAENIHIDWKVVQKNKATVVRRLVAGVNGLLKANQVTVYKSEATITDSTTVQLENGETIVADYIIVASGSLPTRLKFPGSDLPGIIDSTKALSLDQIPESLVIIGGGVIGVEFAQIYSSLGTKVTIVEMLPEILPMFDKEVVQVLKKSLEKNNVVFINQAKLIEVIKFGDEFKAKIQCNGEIKEISTQYVFVAIGRASVTADLGLEDLGIELEHGKIIVDANFATKVPNIYAVGDCNGKFMLAHAASAQGIAAVEHALCGRAHYNPLTIASCIYTSLEIGSVGVSEEEALKLGLEYIVGSFQLNGNGKAMIDNKGVGLVKVIAGKTQREILGLQIVGPHATDLIVEGSLAIGMEATLEDILATIHAHPTISEGVVEAVLDVDGMAIHQLPRSSD